MRGPQYGESDRAERLRSGRVTRYCSFGSAGGSERSAHIKSCLLLPLSVRVGSFTEAEPDVWVGGLDRSEGAYACRVVENPGNRKDLFSKAVSKRASVEELG